MISPSLIRRILLIIVIALFGFILGYGIVHYYKLTHLQPVQLQPAPVLPS